MDVSPVKLRVEVNTYFSVGNIISIFFLPVELFYIPSDLVDAHRHHIRLVLLHS